MTYGAPPLSTLGIPVHYSPYLQPGTILVSGEAVLVPMTYDRDFDRLLAEVRVDAGKTVREGLADVIAWLGRNAPPPHHFGDLLHLGGWRVSPERVARLRLDRPADA